MIRFIGTPLQLQLIITGDTLNFFWTFVCLISMKNLSLSWMHEWTPFYAARI
jgi:hypothetical protein